MKRFRTITVSCLTVIFILVIGDILCMRDLYVSIEERAVQSVNDCIRRAYIIEMLNRIKDAHPETDDSFINLHLLVEGEKNQDGQYEYPNLLESFDNSIVNYFGIVAELDSAIPSPDLQSLNQIFRKELSMAGISPETTEITVYQSSTDDRNDGLWHIDFSIYKDRQPSYTVYFSSLNGHILRQMSGIIVSSVSILILMGFLIWYLLSWVGKLRSIEQMKDDFTHNMTHELKTPVAVAYAAADSMLRYYDPKEEQRNKQFLKIILQRLTFLSGMIENILSMSMERFKTMKLNLEDVVLKPVVEEIAGMIELKASKPVKIKIDIPEDLQVQTDVIHFGNILSNLLDNSVKYSGDTVEIDINANSNSLSVTDNGIGIKPHDQSRIFDKFFRVTDGDRYESGGYGLGLFYVKQTIQLMGWDIHVDSMPGNGTTFTIFFKDDKKRQDIIG